MNHDLTQPFNLKREMKYVFVLGLKMTDRWSIQDGYHPRGKLKYLQS